METVNLQVQWIHSLLLDGHISDEKKNLLAAVAIEGAGLFETVLKSSWTDCLLGRAPHFALIS